MFIQYRKSKAGELIIGSFDKQLCLLDFRFRKMRSTVDTRIKTGLNAEFIEQDNDLIEKTCEQITEYLSGNRAEFDLPLLLVGSDFQKQVWRQLMLVQYGHCASYLELAQSLGNAKAVRAVASANGANAIAFIVPCHRIIGSDGSLVGYGGGLALKKRLLLLEKENSYNVSRSDNINKNQSGDKNTLVDQQQFRF
ncbi:methylated-DNA--[protein]-cysteine S-methyltransferase [Agaribacterium haliotis]|uniref:methylated-DNA--[protein]-cysteine S-methyltransferase n=1 Tax=Agaribacterium haliotis TaxID=2013869 RepID=UPI0023D85737|nr:methylated-DNA--[protein]-cysteine S-methyltransferase [Agaribacterium haliotis]